MTTRQWATLSLITSIIWLILSIMPGGVFTTVPGLPFAAVAFAAGWWSRRQAQTEADASSVNRATWGLGVSCFGCLWQVGYYILWGGIVVAGIGAAWSLWSVTPTP